MNAKRNQIKRDAITSIAINHCIVEDELQLLLYPRVSMRSYSKYTIVLFNWVKLDCEKDLRVFGAGGGDLVAGC